MNTIRLSNCNHMQGPDKIDCVCVCLYTNKLIAYPLSLPNCQCCHGNSVSIIAALTDSCLSGFWLTILVP